MLWKAFCLPGRQTKGPTLLNPVVTGPGGLDRPNRKEGIMYCSDNEAPARGKYVAPLTRESVIRYELSCLVSGGNDDNENTWEFDLFN